MKIKQVMQTSVLRVSEDTPVKEVARMIFSTGISGAPVVKENKLVGIITEEDILSHLYPTIQEIVEDYTHVHDFNWMEKNMHALINAPVKEIMNKDVVSVEEDTPIMKAQSIMLTHKFSRLPVVDKKGNLIGIISQGDIFRQLIKEEMPKLEQERYADFISRHYDDMVDWEKRFELEFPSLFRIFNKHSVSKVLDLGVWTGQYTIELVKEGYRVIGLDHNPLMIDVSNNKRSRLPQKIKNNLTFILSNFTNIPELVKGKVEAVICMGNSLPYLPGSWEKILEDSKKALAKDGVLVLQILNMDRVITQRRRLLNFNLQKEQGKKEHLFLEFFDAINKDKIMHNVVIFESDGRTWIYKGMSSIEIHNIRKKELENVLIKLGYKDISFSGNKGEYEGEYGHMSLIKPFDPQTSEWLTVVAHV